MKSILIDVEFEDLDAGGVIHHPNYIRICERARNRWFAEYGVTFAGLKGKDIAFVISAIKANYFRPIFQESLRIEMSVINHSEKSITILHEMFPISSDRRAPHFMAEITLVSANYSTGRSCPLPMELRDFLDKIK